MTIIKKKKKKKKKPNKNQTKTKNLKIWPLGKNNHSKNNKEI
jgi:hypothetical protein